MIEQYVHNLAEEMGIELADVSLTDGTNLGCKDVQLLDISSKKKLVSTLIFRIDLMYLENGQNNCELEIRIRKALLQLQKCDYC